LFPSGSRPENYERALSFWYGLTNYEHRPPQIADLKLETMRHLLRLVGDPQEGLRILHVAGSKGKGSTAALLAAILQRAGYRTGLFTSPHLTHVEERVQVNGQPISPQELTDLLEEIQGALAAGSGPIEPTFFEVATTLGFLYFRRQGVDAAVVEVGLGGRFDSTNVCLPVLAVITSISLDHIQQLGDRLASIAWEKAGIIKPGRPTVSGVTAPEARPVIAEVCCSQGSPLCQLGADFQFDYQPGRVDPTATNFPRLGIRTRQRHWPLMELGLLGEHQAVNAAVAVSCVEQLRHLGWPIGDQAVAEGLSQVRWPARIEIVGRNPLVILDCAHNVASAEALVATLLTSFPPVRRLLLFAGSADKDLLGMFRVLAPHFSHVFLTRYSRSTRALAVEDLGQMLQKVSSVPFSICPNALEALQAARALADREDLICITGSVYLAGELRPALVEAKPLPLDRVPPKMDKD
jgi:dihydrofolate synthase/folylpolyglutamate synthase